MTRFLFSILIIILPIASFAQPVEEHGQLQVVGTQLQNENNEDVSLHGMSFGWHNWWPRFYNAETVDWLVEDWKVMAVRAAMGVEPDGGYLTDSAFAVDKVKAVVDAAIEEGIYVIIDWHAHNINKDDAIAFFSLMATTYGSYPNVIYEIFNEPDDESWADVKAYSIELIDTIRSIDPDNIILVGSPTWDQDLHLVAADPITGYSNIMYTMHFYAATHGKSLRDRCDAALADGIPIFVSESAGCESSGDGLIDYEAWDAYIQWMESKKISWFCWSISDKDETSAVLNTSASSTGNWETTDLKESGQLCRNLFQKYYYNYEPARIYQAMAKGRRGEDLTIGVIGGSITAGYAASSDNKRWANLMTDWWKETFPESSVTLVNAGWGGTGSDIGVHRAADDLLNKNPDFIVIEFSVNDAEGEHATKMMEGLVQQILTADSEPGVMILMLKQDNGTSAKESHKPVGEYYNIPMVNFADSIDAILAVDGVALSSIFVDGLHPNDVGMNYIADMIKDQLDSMYHYLPQDNELPEINKILPPPLITNTYSTTYQYFSDNLIPLSNDGWSIYQKGWSSGSADNQIDFQLLGNAVSLVYTQTDDSNRGRAEVWVDDGPKKIIDAYMNEDWGTRYSFALVEEGLSDGEHILHIRSIPETSTGGNYVFIDRVLVAGNIGTAVPIAKTSSSQKGAVGIKATFDGSESYDPDGEQIDEYEWTISEKPTGSTASLSNAGESIASFIPDYSGIYTINLIVTSGLNRSIPAQKTFTVRESNSIPVAVVGNDTMSGTNKLFKLDGSNSYDDDGDLLIYKWQIESKPANSQAYVLVDNLPITQFRIDLEGTYEISLMVNDSIENSEKSTMLVTAVDGYTLINQRQKNISTLKVYPNPVREQLTLEFNLGTASPVKVSLYQISGEKIVEYTFSNTTPGENMLSLKTKELSTTPGSYLLNLESDSGSHILPITIL